MEFWGVEVKPGKSLKVSPGEGKVIHLSQSAIGESKKGNEESVILHVKVKEQKLVIGTLSVDKFPQIQYDVVFGKDFELSHNSKKGSVYFCGYRTRNPEEDDEIYSSADFDSESEDEGLGLPIANSKPEPVKAGAGKPVSAGNSKVKIDQLAKGPTAYSDENSSCEDDDFSYSDEDVLIPFRSSEPVKSSVGKPVSAGNSKVKIDQLAKGPTAYSDENSSCEDDDFSDSDDDVLIPFRSSEPVKAGAGKPVSAGNSKVKIDQLAKGLTAYSDENSSCEDDDFSDSDDDVLIPFRSSEPVKSGPGKPVSAGNSRVKIDQPAKGPTAYSDENSSCEDDDFSDSDDDVLIRFRSSEPVKSGAGKPVSAGNSKVKIDRLAKGPTADSDENSSCEDDDFSDSDDDVLIPFRSSEPVKSGAGKPVSAGNSKVKIDQLAKGPTADSDENSSCEDDDFSDSDDYVLIPFRSSEPLKSGPGKPVSAGNSRVKIDQPAKGPTAYSDENSSCEDDDFSDSDDDVLIRFRSSEPVKSGAGKPVSAGNSKVKIDRLAKGPTADSDENSSCEDDDFSDSDDNVLIPFRSSEPVKSGAGKPVSAGNSKVKIDQLAKGPTAYSDENSSCEDDDFSDSDDDVLIPFRSSEPVKAGAGKPVSAGNSKVVIDQLAKGLTAYSDENSSCEDDDFSDSDDDVLIPFRSSEPVKSGPGKPVSAGNSRVKIDQPAKGPTAYSDENSSCEDDDFSDSDDYGIADAYEMKASSDEEYEKAPTPKKDKKTPASKTPVPYRRAKIAPPQKTADGKKVTATRTPTPHPIKQAAKSLRPPRVKTPEHLPVLERLPATPAGRPSIQ